MEKEPSTLQSTTPPDDKGRSTGSVFGRIVGVFAVIGLCLGIGAVFGLWGFGAFDSPRENLEAAITGTLTLIGAYLFVIMVGIVIAALGGHYAARATSNTGSSVLAGSAGGAAGYLVLLVTFILILSSSFAVFGEDSGAGDTDDGTPDMDVLWKAGLAFIPAGIVGGLTAKLFSQRSGTLARPS